MAGARKHPDIAFEIGEKLNIDMRLVGRNPIAERVHGVFGGVLRADIAQWISRTVATTQ